jgi:hypothetical protein
MTTLTINDLHEDHQLDRAALATIRGGVNDWIRTFQPPSALRGSIIGSLNINNYLLINPVFNTLNQYEFVNVDVSESFDSAINVLVNQANAGANTTTPAIPAF